MTDVYYAHNLEKNENGQYVVDRVAFPVMEQYFEESRAYYDLDDVIKRYTMERYEGLTGRPVDIWVLGQDELPNNVKDIRNMICITDEKRYGTTPAYVYAFRNPETGLIGYVGIFTAKDKPWYKVCGIRKTDENRKDDETFEYETFDDPERFTQALVELYEYITMDFPEGHDICILGKDELEEGMEDIRGRVKNEPDVVIAVESLDGESMWYEGLNVINK